MILFIQSIFDMATFKVAFIKEIIYIIYVILRFLLYDFYYNNKEDYKILRDEKHLDMMTPHYMDI